MNAKTTLDSKNGKPKYLALVDLLEDNIAAGKWKPGERLPSNRDLVKMFDVTVGTVSKAMSEAVRRGLVDTRVGSGTYIRGQSGPFDEERAFSPLELSLNTLPTSVVADLLADSLAPREMASALFSYSVAYRAPRHQAFGARWLTALGTPTDEQRVLLTCGVHQGLVAAFQTLLKPGDQAVCEALTYTGIKRIAELRGVRLLGAAVDRDGLIPDDVDRLFAQTDARVLITIPCLQNPTAASLSAERRRQLALVCAKHDARVIEDGVNIPLAGDGLPTIGALAPERTIHLSGLSKCVASGFRLGFASMPQAWLDTFHEALMATQWIGPGFFADLAATMDASGALEKCIARHRAEATYRLALARQLLPNVSVGDMPGYHLWLAAPPGTSSDEFCTQAAGAGVNVSPARHFAVDALASAPEGLRVSLGACETRAELSTALTRLAQVVHQWKPAPMPAVPAV